MGYRIVYGEEAKPKPEGAWTALRLQALTAACLLAFTFGVKTIWPEGTEVLRQVLLPGEPGITEKAFQTFVENVQEGESFGDAVTTFCKEILYFTDESEISPN